MTEMVDRHPDPSTVSSTMLSRLKANEAGAWSQLVALFGPRVYQWCRKWGLQPCDASDIHQVVFCKVAANLKAFRRDRPGDTFHGWLWSIARNAVQDHFRRRAKQPQAFGGTDANDQFEQLPQAFLSDTEQQSAAESRRQIVRRLLDTIRGDFDERSWTAFWRMAVEDHTAAEIGRDLGMTADAVRHAKARVLRRLREEMDGLV